MQAEDRRRVTAREPADNQQELAAAQRYLRLLFRYRPRSRYEVQLRLKNRGYSRQTIMKALAWAEAAGLLDDRSFAKLWVETLSPSPAC